MQYIIDAIERLTLSRLNSLVSMHKHKTNLGNTSNGVDILGISCGRKSSDSNCVNMNMNNMLVELGKIKIIKNY